MIVPFPLPAIPHNPIRHVAAYIRNLSRWSALSVLRTLLTDGFCLLGVSQAIRTEDKMIQARDRLTSL